MGTVPYLHFRGQAAQALSFYAEVLGGADLRMMCYADAPDAPEAWKDSDRVMHGQVRLGDAVLMASDFPPGTEGDPQKAASIMQTFADPEAARAAFDRLGEGGAVLQDFGPTFWSSGFGMVRDRFGTHWILSAEAEARPEAAEAA